MAVSVAFDGTRHHDTGTTLTGWTATGSGVSPTIETEFYYQGVNSISGKFKTSVASLSYTATAISFASPKRIHLFKILATTKDGLSVNGLSVRFGDTVADYWRYDIVTAATYPKSGGWLVVPIDPNLAYSRTVAAGTPAASSIGYFGVEAQYSVSAKSENTAIDAIDYLTHGTGLTMTGTAPNGDFEDFRAADEDGTTGNWGLVRSREGVFVVFGVLTISAPFTDANQTVVFPDARVDDGFNGIDIDLASSSENVDWTSIVFIGNGNTATGDSRPDFEVTGTTSTFDANFCTFDGFRAITGTSAATFLGCSFLNGLLIVQGSAVFDLCTFTAATTGDGVAQMQSDDPGLITNCEFNFSDGHAIEITATGTYDLDGNVFNGYGLDATNDAAIYNNSGGAVTLNVVNGAAPTVRDGASASTTVNENKTLTVTVKDKDGAAVENARVAIFLISDGSELMNELTNASGIATETANVAASADVIVRVRKGSGTDNRIAIGSPQTTTSTGLEITLTAGVDDKNAT